MLMNIRSRCLREYRTDASIVSFVAEYLNGRCHRIKRIFCEQNSFRFLFSTYKFAAFIIHFGFCWFYSENCVHSIGRAIQS